MTFTVVGAGGFIGSHLQAHLRGEKLAYETLGREPGSLAGRRLGDVIYCAGLTADFRSKPLETIEAHVCFLTKLLRETQWDSFLYLSSTRVYAGASSTREDETLRVNPTEPGDLYNLSKLTGESLCLAMPQATARVVRLSNVYGNNFDSEEFLPSIVRDAVERKRVLLRTSLDSEKDYIGVDDVVRVLLQIASSARYRLYNVASGQNTSNRALAELLKKKTGCAVDVAPAAPAASFPPIDTARLQSEFPFHPRPLAEAMDDILTSYHAWKTKAPRNRP